MQGGAQRNWNLIMLLTQGALTCIKTMAVQCEEPEASFMKILTSLKGVGKLYKNQTAHTRIE
jgi:hypothetical protein